MNTSLRKQGVAIVALSLFVLIVYSSQSNLEKTQTTAVVSGTQVAMGACLVEGAFGVSICSPPGAGRCMNKPGPGMDGCKCQAKIPAGGFTNGICRVGCCRGINFNDAKSAAKMDPVAQSGGMEGAGGMGDIGKVLGGLGQLIGQLMQGGGGGGGAYTPIDDDKDTDDDIVLDDDFTIPGPVLTPSTTPTTTATETIVPETVPETQTESAPEPEIEINTNLEPTSTDSEDTIYTIGVPKRRIEVDLFNVAKTPRASDITESAVPEEYYIDPITGERTLRADLEWEGLQNLRNRNKDSLSANELALLEKFNESSIARSKYAQHDLGAVDEEVDIKNNKSWLASFFAWLSDTFGI